MSLTVSSEPARRESDDHPIDAEAPHDLRQVVEPPEERALLEIGPRRPRLVVDEAHEIDAVLGVLLELSRDALPDVSCADDHGVLHVVESSP